MDSMSKKKIDDDHGIDSDIISNLPRNITDQILVLLPITEAVRTSVLSSKWRNKWITIPELVFIDDCDMFSTQSERDNFVNFVDRVLLLHSGLIQKFFLYTVFVPSSSRDRWVLFVLSKNVKELTLKFEHSRNYVLPSCFFSAQQLCTLELRQCELKPPPTFTGFANLKSLNLSECRLGNGVLEHLISKCPLLENLILELHYCLGRLKICAPNLKHSCLHGDLSDVSFENTPLLSVLEIYTNERIRQEQLELFSKSGTCPLVKLLSSLPNIRRFSTMFVETTEFLAVCHVPDKLPVTCHHLSRISLDVDFEYLNQILLICCLFNSSPNLRNLHIVVCSGRYSCLTSEGCTAVYDLNEIQGRIGCNMDRLQVVTMTCPSKWNLNLELKFITFVLANTPMLKRLSFKAFNAVQFSLKEICHLPRASPNAEVKYTGARQCERFMHLLSLSLV